jgi:hypothetical protein
MMEAQFISTKNQGPIRGLALLVVVVGVGTPMLFAVGRGIGSLPVGLTSKWHVPSSTIHNGLRYSVLEPVRCETREAVERSLGIHNLGARRLASDGGFVRFGGDPLELPVEIWLVPKGQKCLVEYDQYAMVG